MPFVHEGSRHILREGTGPTSRLFLPMLAVGVGLALVGGKNVLQHLDIVRGAEALRPVVAWVCLGVGSALVLSAVLAFTRRFEVIFDVEQRTVTREARLLFRVRVRGQTFRFTDFDRVEVQRRAGRRAVGHGAAYTFYVPALEGPRASVHLERMSLRDANAQAHEVARWLGVPAIAPRDG